MTDTERGRDRGLIGAAHTPGPWSLGSVTRVDVATGKMIEDDETGYVEAGDCEITLEGPSAASNARLVAEAPALLAALKDLERAAEAMLDCTDGSERGYLREEAAKARAIIQKAEGRR